MFGVSQMTVLCPMLCDLVLSAECTWQRRLRAVLGYKSVSFLNKARDPHVDKLWAERTVS